MPPFATRARATLAAALLVAIVGACGGAAATPSPTPAATSAATPVATPQVTPAATPVPSAVTSLQVSANTATHEQLVAALEAAGVVNADRWAREIEEYRPYATDDPTLQKLQDNLAKYNPDDATLEGILSALVP